MTEPASTVSAGSGVISGIFVEASTLLSEIKGLGEGITGTVVSITIISGVASGMTGS